MNYVYLLRSIEFPEQTYIGYTTDLKARLKKHNEGSSPHTAKYRPWKIVSYHAFEEKNGLSNSRNTSRAALVELSQKSDYGETYSSK